MTKLSDIRDEITKTDDHIAELFCKRMQLVKQVAEYKLENDLPVFDAEREKAVLKNGVTRITDDNLKDYYVSFLTNVMELSKQYQKNLIEKNNSDTKNILNVNLGKNSYPIYIDYGLLKSASTLLNLNRKVLIVTDSGVPYRYVKAVADTCENTIIKVIPQGEPSKSLDTFAMLNKEMLDNNFSRKDCVVAIGGGVVGDIAGFVAASFMRGVDFYNIPTTLLSQVDSSVGGKTAVNFNGIKNIIGAFYQPKAVIIDPNVLTTLSDEQFSSGLAEIIKMSMTFDKELFEFIEHNTVKDNIKDVIYRALQIKINVVQKDEKEAGLRRVLNFGHTLGHGIEVVTGLPHGHSIALGMLPMCSDEIKCRLKAVLVKENLPIYTDATCADVLHAVAHDKKSTTNGISTITVEKIGQFNIKTTSLTELEHKFKEVFS